MIYEFLKAIGKPVFKVLFSLKVEGLENVPKSGGVILAANHSSFLDPAFIWISIPRKVYSLSKKEVSKHFLFGGLLRKLGAVPLDRDAMSKDTIEACFNLLKKGRIVLIFPEGTRSKNGTLLKPKSGVAYLSMKTKTPIIPVAHIGIRNVMPVGAKFFKIFKKVSIRIGKPVKLYNFFNEDTPDSYKKGAQIIMDEIKKLLDKGHL